VFLESAPGFAENYLPPAHNLNGRIQTPSATTDLIDPAGDSRYEAMDKMASKERFSLFHGTAATISLILLTLFVALGL
jgi:hypothetical protein